MLARQHLCTNEPLAGLQTKETTHLCDKESLAGPQTKETTPLCVEGRALAFGQAMQYHCAKGPDINLGLQDYKPSLWHSTAQPDSTSGKREAPTDLHQYQSLPTQ